MYTSLCFTPRRYPLLHGPSALSLSIPFSVFLPSLYPSFFGPLSLIIFQLAVLICHINSFYTKARNIMFVPFCTQPPFEHLSPTVFCKAYCRCSVGNTHHPPQNVLGKRGMGQGERDDLSQCVSPRQGTAKSWQGGHKIAAFF